MAGLIVDSKGNRIEADIVVSGYIRNAGRECKLLIPEDINCICFAFWLITVCDEWDKTLSSRNINICENSATITNPDDSFTSGNMYGSVSVNQGSYSWKIKLDKKSWWIQIGVIEDDENVLKRFVDGNASRAFDEEGHGCYVTCEGHFCRDNLQREYCNDFGHNDKYTIITMTLDMDKHSISYKIDDIDYGIATDELHKSKYRMVVTQFPTNKTVELL